MTSEAFITKLHSNEEDIIDRKTDTHRRVVCALLVLVVILLCVVVALVFSLVLLQTQVKQNDICLTEQCVRTAARISNMIDFSVNPCDNFYEFACGAWRKTHVIPDDISNFNMYHTVDDKVDVTLKYLLEAELLATDIGAIVKTKDFYQSCMNESRIAELGAEVVLPFLHELQGWPVLGDVTGGNWKRNTFDLVDMLVSARKYLYAPIISAYVSVDVKLSPNKVIVIDQPGFGMPGRDHILKGLDDPMVKGYLKYATDLAEALGADTETAEHDMREMVEFEIKLSNISVPSELRRDQNSTYFKMEARELSRNFTETPKFNWMRYLRRLFSLSGIEMNILDTEAVVVQSPPYFEKLFDIINITDNRTLANYIVWQAVKHVSIYMSEEFQDIRTTYRKAVYGIDAKEARWKFCVKRTVGMFGLAVGRLFVIETFDEDAKSDVKHFVQINLRTRMCFYAKI